jgi:hypothetical protein
VTLGPESQGFQDLIREFERLHPEYEVRVLGMGAGQMNPQKLMTAIVGKVPPDVISQDRFTISDWASRNTFLPLDPLIERDRKRDPLTPTREQYYPQFWEEASYNGQVYGIPTSGDTRALFWNKDVFRAKAKELAAAGLDPNRAPRTWKETLAYSKVLTEFNKDGSLKVAGFLTNRAGHPVKCPELIEDSSPDLVPCKRLELESQRGIEGFDSLDKTDDPGTGQIIAIDRCGKVDRKPLGYILDKMSILQQKLVFCDL